MKIWVDDIRCCPNEYFWTKSVDETKEFIEYCEGQLEKISDSNLRAASRYNIELIDLDHDAGEYADYGGDYIKLLGWIEETGRNYPIRIHSMNPVGVENMRRIIQRNGWNEIV